MNCDTYDYWIFDLDNTLYDIKLSLFKRVSIKITKFIINYFGITKNKSLKLHRNQILMGDKCTNKLLNKNSPTKILLIKTVLYSCFYKISLIKYKLQFNIITH